VTLGGATALAFTPDGALVSGDGKTVSVWNGEELVRSAEVFGHNIHVLAISPDGTRIALGGDEPAVRVCEVATLREVAMVSVPERASALAWMRDGRRLHVLDGKRRVFRWEVGGSLSDVAFDGPGYLAADAQDRVLVGAVKLTLRVRDLAGGATRDIATGLTLGVCAAAVTKGAELVAAGSFEGEVAVWDLASGALKWQDGLSSEPIESLKFSADGRTVAAGNSVEGPSTRNVAVWSAEGGKEILRRQVHGGFFNDLAFSPDGKRLATCSGTGMEITTIG
jgi:WD40 repeat protein